MFVLNTLLLPVLSTIFVPLAAKPVQRRQSDQSFESFGPATPGTAPGADNGQGTPGVILSNMNSKPQTFYFVQNAENSCNPASSAGGSTPSKYVTLTKEQGEVYIPLPASYRGRVQRGPTSPSSDLSKYFFATYAEINMDAFPCSKGDANMHVAEADVSLNHGYDGPIVVHSTNAASPTNPDTGTWGNPLKGGFDLDLIAAGPSAPVIDGRALGYDQDAKGNPVNYGPLTDFYNAKLGPLAVTTPDYGNGKKSSNVAYWSNAQDGATIAMSTNYVVKVVFY